MASWLTDGPVVAHLHPDGDAGMVRIQAFRFFCIIVFLRKWLRGILKKLAISQPTTWLDLSLSQCPVARGRALSASDRQA